MNVGNNICFLRKKKKLTQEQFAEMMEVTRQTVSRWETDEVVPELDRLLCMCTVFACTMDDLVRKDLTAKEAVYSAVTVRKLPAFRMARYVIISPSPEQDVQNYMMNWGKTSGLLAADPSAKLLGWDFPFVSQEQQMRFGLHGYAAAYVLPEGFETNCPGVEYAGNSEAEYAVLTVTDPHARSFERIPNGYKRIMDYLQVTSFKEKMPDDVLPCFEYEYDKDGVHYMDIYLHTGSVAKTEAAGHFG